MKLDETMRLIAPVSKKNFKGGYDANLFRLLMISLLIFIAMTLFTDWRFLSLKNFQAMLYVFPELGILSLGIMLALITGGIDLSIVGIANLSSLCAAMLLYRARDDGVGGQLWAIFLACGLALLVSILCGAFNGFLVAAVGIHPILATLGSMQLFTGIAMVQTRGYAVHSYPEMFIHIGNGSLFYLPIPFWIFLFVGLALAVFLGWRPLGKKIYLTGANAKAAAFSGISTTRTLFLTYMLTGLLGGIGGLVIISRTNSAKADYGAS